MQPFPLWRAAGAALVATLLLGADTQLLPRVPLRLLDGRLEAQWLGVWTGLGDIPYFSLYPDHDPALHLPADIPEPAASEVRALHSRLRAANEGLWREAIHLRGLARAVVPSDQSQQAYLLALQDGEKQRLRMIESNGYHFFLDAALLLPDDFREAWFAGVEAWTPPPFPLD